MTGTQNHEGIAAVAAAVDYLAEIGGNATKRGPPDSASCGDGSIQAYETDLARRLLEGLAKRPRFKIWA